jgi:hypothetical protein
MVQWKGSRIAFKKYVVQLLMIIRVFFIFFKYLYLLHKTIQLKLKIQIQLVSQIFFLTKIFCAQGI